MQSAFLSLFVVEAKFLGRLQKVLVYMNLRRCITVLFGTFCSIQQADRTLLRRDDASIFSDNAFMLLIVGIKLQPPSNREVRRNEDTRLGTATGLRIQNAPRLHMLHARRGWLFSTPSQSFPKQVRQ